MFFKTDQERFADAVRKNDIEVIGKMAAMALGSAFGSPDRLGITAEFFERGIYQSPAPQKVFNLILEKSIDRDGVSHTAPYIVRMAVQTEAGKKLLATALADFYSVIEQRFSGALDLAVFSSVKAGPENAGLLSALCQGRGLKGLSHPLRLALMASRMDCVDTLRELDRLGFDFSCDNYAPLQAAAEARKGTACLYLLRKAGAGAFGVVNALASSGNKNGADYLCSLALSNNVPVLEQSMLQRHEHLIAEMRAQMAEMAAKIEKLEKPAVSLVLPPRPKS